MSTEKVTLSTEKVTFRESSGNIFADLGLDNADDLMAKAELALAIRDQIEQRALNQTQAAEIIGTTQARVSELYNAKVMSMSFERLIGFLKALECDISITVAKRGKDSAEKQGRVAVAVDFSYATQSGSTLSIKTVDGKIQWIEKLSPDSSTETFVFDEDRALEIAEMFRVRSDNFLKESRVEAMFGDERNWYSGADCAYIATALKQAVERLKNASGHASSLVAV